MGRTGDRRVVLDAVVRVQVPEVEAVRPVVAPEEVRGLLRPDHAKRRCEVVYLLYDTAELGELDVAPVARKDACVRAVSPSDAV